jgi:very-short-patch-repair endonuclease
VALGGHDNLDEFWPTRWIEQFEATLARYCIPPDGLEDQLAWTLARRTAGCAATGALYEQIRRILARCESPIERAFLAAAMIEWGCSQRELCVWCGRQPECWHHLARFLLFPPAVATSCAFDLRPPYKRVPRIVVYPQLSIGPYRADFLLVWQPGVLDAWPHFHRTMVVECDGHEFHEKSKEQATADKARDRYMQARGHLVFRFSGSDIWRDAIACARETLSVLTKERA